MAKSISTATSERGLDQILEHKLISSGSVISTRHNTGIAPSESSAKTSRMSSACLQSDSSQRQGRPEVLPSLSRRHARNWYYSVDCTSAIHDGGRNHEGPKDKMIRLCYRVRRTQRPLTYLGDETGKHWIRLYRFCKPGRVIAAFCYENHRIVVS